MRIWMLIGLFSIASATESFASLGRVSIQRGEEMWEALLVSGKVRSAELERVEFYSGDEITISVPEGTSLEIKGRPILFGGAKYVISDVDANRGFVNFSVVNETQAFAGKLHSKKRGIEIRTGGKSIFLTPQEAGDPNFLASVLAPGSTAEVTFHPPGGGTLMVGGKPVGAGAFTVPGGGVKPSFDDPEAPADDAAMVKLTPEEANNLMNKLKASRQPGCDSYIDSLASAAAGQGEAWAQVKGKVNHQDPCSRTAQGMLSSVVQRGPASGTPRAPGSDLFGETVGGAKGGSGGVAGSGSGGGGAGGGGSAGSADESGAEFEVVGFENGKPILRRKSSGSPEVGMGAGLKRAPVNTTTSTGTGAAPAAGGSAPAAGAAGGAAGAR